MSVIRNSPRAFLIALLPLALLHAALMANGIAPAASKGALPAPDQAVITFVIRLGLDGSLLWLGHIWQRSLRLHGRGAYAVMGGFAAAIGYMAAYRLGVALTDPVPGTLVTGGILPVATGMLSGFLYAQLAGRLAVLPEFAGPVSPAAVPPYAAGSEIPPVFALYNGPVQVRTSIGASTMAAAVPAFVVSMLTIGVVMPFVAGQVAHEPHSAMNAGFAAILAFPAQVMFATLFMMFVPSLIVVGATHGIARSLRRTRGLDYAGIGAGVGLLAAMVLAAAVPVTLLGVAGALIGALMGLIYRRFAGIEPLALPEDVLADDPAALVPEDHPTRKSHAVVFNG